MFGLRFFQVLWRLPYGLFSRVSNFEGHGCFCKFTKLVVSMIYSADKLQSTSGTASPSQSPEINFAYCKKVTNHVIDHAFPGLLGSVSNSFSCFDVLWWWRWCSLMYLNLIWLSGFYSVVPYLSKIKNWELNDKHNYFNLDQLTKNRYEMTTIDTHHEVNH